MNDLTFDEISDWPVWAKSVAIVAVFLFCLFLGHYFFIADDLSQIDSLKSKESHLRLEVSAKASQAANIKSYEAQVKEMKAIFQGMLRILPRKNEVPDLLVDITRSGVAAGLDFKKLEPLPDVKSGFYTELPMVIHVTGKFRQLGSFVELIAALSRIVTLHDFTLSRTNDDGLLTMTITAKTYRYKDEQ